ncbi:MAG: T9SS type A sorting domain-containing protein [Ignavibacteria bacterium]
MKALNFSRSGIGIILISLITGMFTCLHAQYKINDYDFPLPSSDFGKSVIKRIDNGFAVAGFSYSYPLGFPQRGYDWMFVRLNNDATVDRARLIGFSRDTANNDFCYSLVQLGTDSGFVLAGAMSNPNNKLKATLVKLDRFCNLRYSKRIKDTLRSQYRQVIKGPGDTLVFAGFIEGTTVAGVSANKILVARYKPDGTRLWIYKYDLQSGSTIIQEAYSVCYQPWDNSYAVLAKYGPQGVLILKLNRLGQILAQRTYSFPNVTNYVTEGRKIIPMPDGGFVAACFTQAFDDVARDMWVFRVESDLDLVWTGIYGNDNVWEEAHSITLNVDTLVFAGFSGVDNRDLIYVKISVNGGAPLWSKKYDISNDERGFEILTSTTAGSQGYTLFGHKNFPVGTGFDALFMQVNLSGEIPGTECIASFNLAHEVQNPVIATPNLYRFSKTDTVWSPTTRTPTVALTTLCVSEAASPVGTENISETPVKFSLGQNYPNPFNPSTKISFSIPVDGIVSIKIYDITGREVMTLINMFKQKGNYSLELDARNLPSGVYFYKLHSNGFEDTKKMVLIK